jgi:glutaconate CoA-transferase subunit A
MGRAAERRELEQLVATFVPRDAVVALGGLHFHNTPMALVREIIRNRIPIARLVPPVDGSINADQLIGAGLVGEIHTPYVGLEHIGMAPRFRAAVEGGTLRVRETEEAGFMFGIQAGATGLPFAVLPAGFFPEDDERPTVPTANRDDYAEIVDPFDGGRHHVARAIVPDVALLQCQLVDAEGNLGYLGSPFFDFEIARAARVCVALVDRAVDRLPDRCTLKVPSFLVDAYCVLEGGAHPAGSHRHYRFDEDHIRYYAGRARSDEGFARYVDEVIGTDETSYREAARVEERLAALRAEADR